MNVKKIKIIFSFLLNKEKNNFFFLIFIFFVTSVLEMMGIASILPFIAILSDPEIINNNGVIKYFYIKSSFFGIKNNDEFLFLVGFLVFLTFSISILFKILSVYFQNRFVLMLEYNIGKALVDKYLNQPYEWFLNNHSADLGKSVLSEVGQIVNHTIVPTLNVIVNTILVIFLFILVFIVDPILALSINILLILSYKIIFLFVKKKISELGVERLEANRLRFTIMSDIFKSIREIKSRDLENFFLKKFVKPASVFTKSQASALLFAHLPRYFIESIMFGGMIISILILMDQKGSFFHILPTLSLFAFSAYRLIPALQNIYSSLSLIKYSEVTLSKIYHDTKNISRIDKNKKNNILIKNFIQLKNISFNYSESESPVLKDINFHIDANCKVGITGVSGSGKTTLISIILGLLTPNKGNLVIDNIKIKSDEDRMSMRRNIGYIPQNIYLADDTIAKNIAFGKEKEEIDYELVYKVAKIANVHDFIQTLPKSYETVIGENGERLSGGQRQRLGIARALYYKPKVLIFDEATNSLDSINEKKLINEIFQNIKIDLTIIFVTHNLNILKKCDKILLIKNSYLVAEGHYDQLQVNNEYFKSLLQ
jgi:ABC-type bacteriocin/lantibiotic exporter with double-glycine peptidase domain